MLIIRNLPVRGRKITDPNPQKSNTLEWTTPIYPGYGNWPAEIPEVHRWPYDYKEDGNGNDFIPKTGQGKSGEETNYYCTS